MDSPLTVLKICLGPAILIAFWLVQHVLLGGVRSYCKTFRNDLSQATPGSTPTKRGFSWLELVLGTFAKNGGWVDNPPLPRDAVIDSLDNEIWRHAGYNKLQRLGLAAPLLGVILSGAGFIAEGISPASNATDFNATLRKLAPLFMGVVMGAMMALINQYYLYRASAELTGMRLMAARWFDSVIWGKIREKEHNALGEAAQETRAAARQLAESSLQIGESNEAYRGAVTALSGQIEKIKGAAERASMSFDSQASALEQMTVKVKSTIDQFVSLAGTASAVKTSNAALNDSAEKMRGSAETVKSSAEVFFNTCVGMSTKFEELQKVMTAKMSGAAEGLETAAAQLTAPVFALGVSIENLHKTCSGTTTGLNALEVASQQAQIAFAESIRQSTESTAKIAAQADRFFETSATQSVAAATRMEQQVQQFFQLRAQQTNEGTTAMEGVSRQLIETCARNGEAAAARVKLLESSESALLHAAQNLATAAGTMRQQIDVVTKEVGDLRKAGTEMRGAGVSLQETLGQHRDALSNLPKASQATGAAYDQTRSELGKLRETTDNSVSLVGKLNKTVQDLQQSLQAGVTKQPWLAMPGTMTALQTSIDALTAELKHKREARKKMVSMFDPRSWWKRNGSTNGSITARATETELE